MRMNSSGSLFDDDDDGRSRTPPAAGALMFVDLENMDLGRDDLQRLDPNRDVLLDSPRSVEACLRLGLCPSDFFSPTYDEVVKSMKDKGENIQDDVVCKMRYSYLVHRAKQKHAAACEERVRVIAEESAGRGYGSGGHGGVTQAAAAADNSTRIQDEERRLAKIVDNNKHRLRQQLLHHQLIEKQREREEQKKESQRRSDEAQAKRRLREMIERSKKEEEAQALRNEARELEQEEQRRRVELKRALYEAKDRQVKDRIQKQRLEAEAENEAKRLLNLQRQQQMREQADKVTLERRKEFQRRNEIFEAAQADYKHQLEVKREEHRAIARLKHKKIMDAIQRSNDQQEAKIQRALEKERQADELRKLQAEDAAEQQRIKHANEAQREAERLEVLRAAQQRQRDRVEHLEEKIASTEEHMEDLHKQREAEARIRSEVQKQKELDKADCVRRSKFTEEYRVRQIDESNREKILRVERLQQQQALLKEKRKLHREEAERTRVKIEEVTPGPSDFVPQQGAVGMDAPRWKIGLPASALAMRVIMKNVPAAGYHGSPGPCVYRYENIRDARHRQPEAFSMIKHDRWAAQSEMSVTPGPQDYAPSSPPVHRSRPQSSLQ
jgi:hypothetical protein